ncbi:MAG: hypothetical protein K1X74_19370 [Pirellulales bacterium]|nr:hypothetical protein [Pirellulales bacterium]
MSNTHLAGPRYLGMRPGDLDGKPYARHWNPTLGPLPSHIHEALLQGPIAGPLLPPWDEAPRIFESGEPLVDNAYCVGPDGAQRIALVTDMPGVSPNMIDWWFGWHSDEPQRYKLWNPHAHVHAEWRTRAGRGAAGRDRYVGQTSCVDEYVGSELGSYAIQFRPPEEFGLDPRLLADPALATAVCARVGFARAPIDIGYLMHYVTRTATGSVMRSRFWLAGSNAGARSGGPVGALMVAAAKRVLKAPPALSSALLVHCSQEMSHLAIFLPALYAELGQGSS